MSKPVFLTDEQSFEWVEANTWQQAVERFEKVWGSSFVANYDSAAPEDLLEETWMAPSEKDDEWWDRVIGPTRPDTGEPIPGALRGFQVET